MIKDNEDISKEYIILKRNYEKLKEEYLTYQRFIEDTLRVLNEKNILLEKKLDLFSNIIEISKYINSNISNDDLLAMINDMIIGIIGVTYSSIYLKENGKMILKTTNVSEKRHTKFTEVCINGLEKGEHFIINCEERLFPRQENIEDIHSILGVPIFIKSAFKGFIVIEHSLFNFFSNEHIDFVFAIANQIAIALENNCLYKKVKERSIRDPLLDINNRRHFFSIVEKIIESSPCSTFGVVMIDIDDFKKVNDTYGHQYGDEVLIQTVKIIQKNITKQDMIARYGGEEIIIYLHNCVNYEQTFKLVDEIRKQISENLVEQNGNILKITASFGLSYYPLNGCNLEDVIKAADVALYKAKRSGKNKVVHA